MERLLHYTWQNKLFPAGPHKTTHGIPLEIITPGVHNSDAGPDFIGSIVRINGMEFAGNVEIHTKSSDWYRGIKTTENMPTWCCMWFRKPTPRCSIATAGSFRNS